jgi:hypothetical protein
MKKPRLKTEGAILLKNPKKTSGQPQK